jgi:hypothetical protein
MWKRLQRRLQSSKRPQLAGRQEPCDRRGRPRLLLAISSSVKGPGRWGVWACSPTLPDVYLAPSSRSAILRTPGCLRSVTATSRSRPRVVDSARQMRIWLSPRYPSLHDHGPMRVVSVPYSGGTDGHERACARHRTRGGGEGLSAELARGRGDIRSVGVRRLEARLGQPPPAVIA